MNPLQSVPTLDELIAQDRPVKKSKGFSRPKKVLTPEEQEERAQRIITKQTEKEKKQAYRELQHADSAIAALKKDAAETLNHYIGTNPTFVVIKQQIEVLKEKAIEYKKAGEIEHFNTCQEQLMGLLENKKKFERILRNTITKQEKDEYNSKISNSKVIKEKETEIKQLTKKISDLSINSVMSRLFDIRRKLDYRNNGTITQFENIEDDEEVLDFDEVLERIEKEDEKEFSLEADYRKILDLISKQTGVEPEQLRMMTGGAIKNLMKETRTDEDQLLKTYKQRILELRTEIKNEKRNIRGFADMSEIINSNYDVETDARIPKEILAASHIKFVENTAYSICYKLNMMHELSEAVAFGLLSLSVALNRWEKMSIDQRETIDFQVFLGKYIRYEIQRSLLGLKNGGMITGSTIAHNHHKKSKYIEQRVVELRTELKGSIPDEVLVMIANEELGGSYDSDSVVNETDLMSIIGGEDGDSADIWSNSIPDASNDTSSYTESKEARKILHDSLKKLFTLFKRKTDTETGLEYTTNTRIFDEYDFELFKLQYGIVLKELPDGTIRPYNQTEMAEHIMEMWKRKGITKTISQSAIHTRLKVLDEKIKSALEMYPEIKNALKYLLNYYKNNSIQMEEMSVEDSLADMQLNTIQQQY